jgi:arginine N-succinyltransferase
MPHPNGRAAMRMLETEGFSDPGYVDIFDGGPTMVGQINSLQTIIHAQDVALAAVHDSGGEKQLVAAGQHANFRCTYGFVRRNDGEAISIDKESAARLGLEIGQRFTMVARA